MKILSMADTSTCPKVLDALAEVGPVTALPPDRQVLEERIGEFHAYLASLHVQVTKTVLDRAKKLQVIATPSTGTDHIDVEYARTEGIAVLSLKDETAFLDNVTATAEMAWALLLAVVRKLPWSFADAQAGKWSRDKFRGRQLSGKTLGILGYGRLGKMVAEFGQAFRMRVVACDIRPVMPSVGITMVDLDTLLKESDVVSVHIHLTEDNRGLINRERLAMMKPGVVLVNTSRGAVIDEPALLGALESGRLGGAGLDVIDGEWRHDLISHPLIRYAREHDNLVISPHTGGVTHESQAMTIEFIVKKLKNYLLGTSKNNENKRF